MKRMLSLFLTSLLILSCSPIHYQNSGLDVHTGVTLRDREIVVMDRNLGANSFGGDGTYMTWREAIDACPKGYHLMTMAEATYICNSEKYDNYKKLVNGDLGLPLAGLIPFRGKKSEIVNYLTKGYYHLADIYQKNQSMAMQINPLMDSASATFVLNSDGRHRDKMSVRCVKDYQWDD